MLKLNLNVTNGNELEIQFDGAMIEICSECQGRYDFPPNRFLQMRQKFGAVEAARRVICAETIPESFIRLARLGRLDLTVEYVVLNQAEFRALFTEDVIQTARDRLIRYGYNP